MCSGKTLNYLSNRRQFVNIYHITISMAQQALNTNELSFNYSRKHCNRGKLSLCLINHHALKTHDSRRRLIAPLFFTLALDGASRPGRFTFGKEPPVSNEQQAEWSHRWSGHISIENNPNSCRESSIGRPASSQLPYWPLFNCL
jgi:hypothetical protein